MSILWKEWRQQRLIFVLGCGLGIIAPLLELLYISRYGGGMSNGGGVVLCCGALYALILAVVTTQEDVRRGVSEFWQSRPIQPGRVFATKLLLGAALLLTGFLFVESLDLAHGDRWGGSRVAWNILTVTWPIALLLFSAAMFFTVLMRDAARSVMVAIWLGLLVYFLPLLVGGLRWMNVFDMLFEGGRQQPSILLDIVAPMLGHYGNAAGQVVPGSVVRPVPVVHMTLSQYFWFIIGSPEYVRYLVFVSVMLAGATGCLVLSIMAVKRQWCWQPGQKTLSWTIGLSATVIFSLAMFQVGHNLEPATTYNGKPIDPVMRFGQMTAAKVHDWVGSPPADVYLGYPGHGWATPRICTSGEYLYSVATSLPTPGISDAKVQTNSEMLDVFRLPSEGGTPEILTRVRFASTPPLTENVHRAITVQNLSIRQGRLFATYQVYLPAEGETGRPVEQPRGTFLLRMLVADVSNPCEPRRISDVELDRSKSETFQSRGDSLYGEFCYVWEQRQLLVVSLADIEHPKVVRKVSIADFGLDPDRPELVEQLSVVNDRLLCVGHRVVLLLDLADPQSPRMVFRRLRQQIQWEEEAVLAALYSDDLLYLSMGSRLEIHRLSPTLTGELRDELVGQRHATPLERLAGRQPRELVLRQGYLYEAAERFGMLVYDVSDPSRPRRAYHADTDDYIMAIGTWQGLLYMNGTLGTLTLVAMP